MRMLPFLLALAIYGCTGIPIPAAEPAPAPIIQVEQTPGPKPLGWKSNPHHKKSLPQIVTAPGFTAKVKVHDQSLLDDGLFYFTNQNNTGACTAFTGGEAIDCVWKKQHGTFFNPSFLDLYQQELVHDGNFPEDAGSYTASILWVLKNRGVCLTSSWPYVESRLGQLAPQNPQVSGERLAHMAVKAYDVPNDDGGYSVQRCIDVLKIPVAAGGYWFGNQFSAKKVTCRTKDAAGNSITVTRYVLSMPKGRAVGGHEILFIGYDKNMVFPGGQVGGVRFKNHWQGFGDRISSAWAPVAFMFNPRYFEDFGAVEITK